jgi:hypothetical protein
MQNADGSQWRTDEKLFAELKGGQALIERFGGVPSFHDSTLDQLTLADGNATLTIRAFRMTSEVDQNGYFILDNHVTVTVHLDGVSGLALSGNASSTISCLGIRRLEAEVPRIQTCEGPTEGDLEISIETSYGLEGSIYARQITLSFHSA